MRPDFHDLISTGTSQFYAGIGARDTPEDVLALMPKIGKALAGKGLIVRLGSALERAGRSGPVRAEGGANVVEVGETQVFFGGRQ